MRQSASENEMAVKPATSWRDLRERHSHLERYPGLFGQYRDRADTGYRAAQGPEQVANRRAPHAKMVIEGGTSAGMGLVPVREPAAAPGANPKRAHVRVDH
jgi:hypothetical protein